MNTSSELTKQFERSRHQLRSLAFRMLGSAAEADDAVQETWLRAARADVEPITHVPAWLARITGRVCLDMLRARRRRRESPTPLEERGSEPSARSGDPQEQLALSESVGLALLVMLERMTPAERVAFVLHDVCALPFDAIGPVVGRSPKTAKKLASRARQRLHGTPRVSRAELAAQREIAERFLAAARARDVEAMLAVLAPDVVRREERGTPQEIRGARRVVEETLTNAGLARFARPALVAGVVGVVVAPRGQLRFVLALKIRDGRVAELTVIGGRARLGQLELAVLEHSGC